MEDKMKKNKNKEEYYPTDLKTWAAQPRKNYGGTYGVNGLQMPVYTKNQMKSLYPSGGYKVAAEYAPGTRERTVAALRVGDTTLPLTKNGVNNRIVYRVKGYAAIEAGDDYYVAILEKVIVLRAAVSALILAVLIVGVTLMAGGFRNPNIPVINSTPSAVTPQLESGAVDWEGIKVSEPENAPADGIRIPGFKSITIEADTTEVSVNLQNPEQNKCYFVIRLVLLDTGETLYESKMIEPGKGLYNITLSRALEAGSYNAQLQYDPYDMTNLTRLNGAVINLELIAD